MLLEFGNWSGGFLLGVQQATTRGPRLIFAISSFGFPVVDVFAVVARCPWPTVGTLGWSCRPGCHVLDGRSCLGKCGFEHQFFAVVSLCGFGRCSWAVVVRGGVGIGGCGVA